MGPTWTAHEARLVHYLCQFRWGAWRIDDVRKRYGTVVASLVRNRRRVDVDFMDDVARQVCTELSWYLRERCNHGRAVFYDLRAGDLTIRCS